MRGKFVLVLLLAFASSAIAVGASEAATTTKHAVRSAGHLCQLGEFFPHGGYVKANCTPNPIFAKTICDTFQPQIESIIPGATVGKGYFPSYSPDHVSCWYKVDGWPQAASVTVLGGISPFRDEKNNIISPAEALEQEFTGEGGGSTPTQLQQCPYVSAAAAAAGGPNTHPLITPPTLTTIGGFKGFTYEPCPVAQPDSPDYNPSRNWGNATIVVMAGRSYIKVNVSALNLDVTPSQLMPFVERLIKTYKTKA